MDNFGLVDVLEQYCIDNDIKFLYGDEFYQNADDGPMEYEENQLIMIADFDFQTVYTNANAIDEIRYVGIIGMGRKFETPTAENPEGTASLDESILQKYKNRLKDLTTLLSNAITQIACDNELEITNVNGRFDINKFDNNSDFVITNLTLIQ